MLRARWLGRVRYQDAHALQKGLFTARTGDDWLLLLEHPHVYTLGVRAKAEHVLVPPASVGAELVHADRGGDVTYHGPGQLTGYPILSLPMGHGATAAYVHAVEQLIIDVLADVGLAGAGRLSDHPGVWVGAGTGEPRKICAIGVRRSRGRTMHGFALNVDPDMAMFEHIVPCGIPDKAVTSLRAEGVGASMAEVVDAVVDRAAAVWGGGSVERQDVAWRHRPEDLAPFSRGEGPGGAPVRLLGRLQEAGVDPSRAIAISDRKPPWMRVKAAMGPEYRQLKRTMRSLGLVTVCEEAGCPNIFECWADGTATFMINGERCTRACGFCLVDTRHPQPLDPGEPARVAEAVERMGLAHAVITAVARDDLADGGAAAFAAVIDAVHRRCPGTAVEVLIADCKGEPDALASIFAARPEVLAHNIETVARLQRAVRPSAGYARSLGVLARAKASGLTTKSSLVLGMGESEAEVIGALADLRGVGVDIVTLGQYLRPTTHHLPVDRWWTPPEFERLAAIGASMGFAHVQSSPLTRSSYHARQASELAASGAPGRLTVVFGARMERVRVRMTELGVDALLLSLGADLPWLTGYTAMPLERLTMLVLPADGDAVLVVPRLEAPRVVERPDVFVLRPWSEEEDPVAVVAGLVGTRRRLAISDRAWSTFLLALQRRLPDTRWDVGSLVTGPIRAVKDAAEIEALRVASAAADRVAIQLLAGDIPLIGRSEAEVSKDIGARLVAEGHARVNFAIVGSGPNAASPHHEPGDRVIGPAEAVVCDFGGTFPVGDGAGYCSDITRTVFTGEPPAEFRDLYGVLQAAQAAAVDAAVVGTTCEAVDAVARDAIADAGYGEHFIHRTGHGIGLEEHEDPYIVRGNVEPLAPGHAFSVEPGIYIAGRFGARIEDIVVAAEGKPDVLNAVDHSLHVIEA